MPGKKPKKRGAKGGIRHQPGRGHARKSGPAKKHRYVRHAELKRQQQEEQAREAWATWDSLPDEVRRLLGPDAMPTMPRPQTMGGL